MEEVPHPDAPAGKAAKYARRERERRFLLARMPAGEVVGTAVLSDRYLEGTRLRLRRAVGSATGISATAFKLTQKIPAAGGGPGLITTCYLSRAEYERFASLPARVLRKTRHSLPPLGIDVFSPPHDGLILGEVEFDSAIEQSAFVPPPFAVAEVTADLRFTGGRLAGMTRDELRRILADFGIHLA